MPEIKWQWVFQQLTDKKASKAAGDAAIELLKVWENLKLTSANKKEAVEIFTKLSMNQPLVVPADENEFWIQARPGDIKVGDEMMVLPNAYEEPELATIHNGRRGKVVRISYGDIILKYTDGKEPAVEGAHHSPWRLQKLVNRS